uniref:Integrin alpha-X-like n=1 Tax=Sinocyclocheilus anshuiensis TaxID=1608454 RepID=A0A671RAD4_9TELE
MLHIVYAFLVDYKLCITTYTAAVQFYVILQILFLCISECHVIPPLDAVILFDDSGSITSENFETMIRFIKNLIAMFLDTRAQVAVAKFSTKVSAVFHFENFAVKRDPDQLMKDVTQAQGDTYTPSAIRFVLEEMFSEKVGMRSNSQKLLLVITDGKSNDPKEEFKNVILKANERDITRFAIGVGKEYSHPELELIASSPQFVFETESFSALTLILNQLREKIFSIEGTDSFQMELSQGGFSVALSEGSRMFGAVGAYSWSGGIVQDLTHQMLNSSFINATNMEEDIRDSYLGYSVAVASVNGHVVYFAGAPRHRHKGLVLGFTQNDQNHSWTIKLCVVGVSELLAVGAPLYHAHGVGGEVRICPLNTTIQELSCSAILRGVVGNEFGRFGTSLAAIQDLNGDGFKELAVGAPQEEKGKGAIYIFLGQPGGIRTEYSQRVSGAAVGGGLQYFGVALHSVGDLTSDALTDVVVGSRGAVTVLRSQPVMCLPINVTVDPPIIHQKFFHCSAPLGLNTPVATVTICMTVKEIVKGDIQGPFGSVVSVDLELKLDPWARAPRLLFGPRSASFLWTLNGNLSSISPVCTTLYISIPVSCISDYHEVPLSGRMKVTTEVIPGTGGLRPVLSPDCWPAFTEMVVLEKVCGEDHVCISDLNVSLSFMSDTVVSTAGYPVILSVEVSNNGEDSTDTELFLYHPTILSFTHVKTVRYSLNNASMCHLIVCSIQLLTDQPIIFRFTGNISSGNQVKYWSQFSSALYLCVLQIVTELEVPSQALAVLIASLSVIFGLLAMTIIFVLSHSMITTPAFDYLHQHLSTKANTKHTLFVWSRLCLRHKELSEYSPWTLTYFHPIGCSSLHPAHLVS